MLKKKKKIIARIIKVKIIRVIWTLFETEEEKKKEIREKKKKLIIDLLKIE